MTLVCLLLTSTSVFAQTKTVTGTVTDAANEPLIGASVLVQGTSTGTTSGPVAQLDNFCIFYAAHRIDKIVCCAVTTTVG